MEGPLDIDKLSYLPNFEIVYDDDFKIEDVKFVCEISDLLMYEYYDSYFNKTYRFAVEWPNDHYYVAHKCGGPCNNPLRTTVRCCVYNCGWD